MKRGLISLVAVVALVVSCVALPAARVEAATPATIGMSIQAFGRDATRKLAFDVVVTVDQSTHCYTSDDVCLIYLYAQLVDGSTVALATGSVPSDSAGGPWVRHLTGPVDVSKVVALKAVAAASTSWVPVPDPLGSSSVSLVVNSLDRDVLGKLAYDVSVTATEPIGDGRTCWDSDHCTLYLYAQELDGRQVALGDVSPPASSGSTYTYPFIGSADVSGVLSVRAVLLGQIPYSGSKQVATDWVSVADPLATHTTDSSLSLSLNSFARDQTTGNLAYDVSGSVSNLFASNGPCAGILHCYLTLQTLSAAGEIDGVGSVEVNTSAPTYTHPFLGAFTPAKIAAVRVLTEAQTDHYGAWVPVTDQYPDLFVSVVTTSTARDATTGNLTYRVKGFVSGVSAPDGPCGGGYQCQLHLQGLSVGGEITDLTSSMVDPGTNLYSKNFAGSIPSDKIIKVRVFTSGYHDLTKRFNSPWKVIHDRDKSESAGGGNASEKGCECGNGDPVNTQSGEFYDTLTDLDLPGVGPAVMISRTYSSLRAAVNGPFGYGTTSNFNSSLMVDTAGDSSDPLPRQVHIVQENGATVPFAENSSGLYPADPWVLASLTHDAGTGNWTLTRTKGVQNTLVFDSDGDLISASDLNGNTVEYHYTSGHVSSITGSGGREIDLTWSSGHVSTIQDSAGRVVSYGYDGSGNLTTVDAADAGLWSYTYDSSHLLLAQTKPAGGVLTNVYNSTGQVTSQTDEVGRVTGFSYAGDSTTVTLPDGSVNVSTYNQGQLASLTTASGTALAATTTYEYNDAGDKVSVTDPLGKVTSYTYDSAGNPLTTTDPLGKATTRTYGSLNDVLTVQDPLGRTSTMTYNSAGVLTSVETPGGHTTSFSLNTDGTVDTSTDARGKTTSYTYDSAGRPSCVTDPDSRETCLGYDDRGLVTTKTDAAGKVTHLTYDNAGRVLTVEDPNSHTTTYVYDGDGNLTSTQDASGNTVTATYDDADQRVTSTDGRGKTTSYAYTLRGSVLTVTDPNGHVTTNAYDAQSQLTSVTDPDGHVTSYTYDLAGHKTSTTMPSGAVTSSTYDDDGRVATTTDALGKVTTYAYDDAGQLHSVTDPLSRVTSYSYTDDGKLHVTTLPDSSTETYAYNADDVQTSFENADEQTATYAYDDAGLLTSETQPGSMTTSYTYDSAGRIHTVTTPDGVAATKSYDDGGRLTGVNYPGTADDVTYTYFADGTRHTMTDGTGTTTYAYNNNAALTSVQNGDGQSIGYGYDNASQLTSIAYPGSKTVTYGHDNAGNMTSVTDWASRTTNLTVTADGLQNTRTDPSGVTETRSYNANDQLTDINTATISATLADYGYGYDNAGQLTSSSLTDAIHTTTTTNAWGYTDLGRLSSTGPSASYATTPAGELTATPAGDAFTYNSKQELASATNTGSGTSTAYSYNDNGSRTATATTLSGTTTTVSYGYDARGNLATVTRGGTTVTYQSDGDGLRQSRTVGASTKQFLWDPNHAIPVLLDDGTDSYIYATSTTPIAQINDSTGVIEYLHADNVGSVRTITSATGTVTGTTDYTPYGQATTHTGTSNSAFGYATAWTDPTTALDYLRAREYDPNTTQSLQVDPALDQTHQPYEYVAGNPLNARDPTGLIPGGCGPNVKCPSAQDYSDLWASVSKELNIAQAGFDDGATGGLASKFALVCTSYQSDNLYWTEYAIGGVVMTAATLGTGQEISIAVKGASGIVDGFGLTDEGATTAADAAGQTESLTSSQLRAIKSLKSNIADHQQKLDEYLADPDSLDHKGILEGKSEEIRNQIIEGRVKHLQQEIKAFQQQIDRIEGHK